MEVNLISFPNSGSIINVSHEITSDHSIQWNTRLGHIYNQLMYKGKDNSRSCLDHIFVELKNKVEIDCCVTYVLETLITDHCATILNWNVFRKHHE